MKAFYKILLVIAFLPLNINSQTYQVFKKSFDTETFETLNLDLENSHLLIEKSEDDKVHFSLTMEFQNYSKKEIESALEDANISTKVDNRQLILKTRSDNLMSRSVLSVENSLILESSKDKNTPINTKKYRESKQHILSLVNTSRKDNLKKFLDRFKEIDDGGKKKKINTSKVKVVKTNFTIKVPDKLSYTIKAKYSNINFDLDIYSPISLNSENSSFKFREIANDSNSVSIKNGKFSARMIEGGSYFFDSVKDIKLVEIDSIKVKSEFSDFEIGQIGNNVQIEDFNGKFWIHNFKQDFGLFKMKLEYSEVNLFYPENSEYSLTTFGHTTKHITNLKSFEIPPKRENTPTKMLVMESGKNATNKIDINAEHSIIRLGEDYIDLSK